MSDLFHDDVPLEYVQKVFAVMNQANWHHYQILTKRASRVHELSCHLPWAPHIWMGVSVEDNQHLDRIDHPADRIAQRARSTCAAACIGITVAAGTTALGHRRTHVASRRRRRRAARGAAWPAV